MRSNATWKFNNHFRLEGRHAFLSASKGSWRRYDLTRMKGQWQNQFKAQHGTRLHAIAAQLIAERIKLPRTSATLNAYVNDAIGFRMQPEVVLRYTDDFFGTADAIKYEEGQRLLRIHDLKTGVTKVGWDQPYIYAALFCLEYSIDPFGIRVIARIYQNDQVYELELDPSEIRSTMDTGITFAEEIEKMREEQEL